MHVDGYCGAGKASKTSLVSLSLHVIHVDGYLIVVHYIAPESAT